MSLINESSNVDASKIDEFWAHLDSLVNSCEIVIDRPKNSPHPRFPELVYPLDYGYLEGTMSMDGGGIDVWIGSDPDRSLEAIILTVDLKKKDAEIKVILGCSEEEKRSILSFLNIYSMRAIMVHRLNQG